MNQLTIDVNTDPGSSIIGQRLILKDGSAYVITNQDYQILCGAYPTLDVNSELNKMVAWHYSNPSKRKTRKGIMRSVNTWLSRAMGNTKPRFERANTGIESTRDRAIKADLTDRSWAE